MTKNGSYTRGIKETGETITIQRMICPVCNGTEAVLADFIAENKQYSADEIEAVVIESGNVPTVYEIDTKASPGTVRRWLKETREKAEAWVSLLKAHMVETQGAAPSEITMSDLPLIERIRELRRWLPGIESSGNLLGYASMYVATLRYPAPT